MNTGDINRKKEITYKEMLHQKSTIQESNESLQLNIFQAISSVNNYVSEVRKCNIPHIPYEQSVSDEGSPPSRTNRNPSSALSTVNINWNRPGAEYVSLIYV